MVRIRRMGDRDDRLHIDRIGRRWIAGLPLILADFAIARLVGQIDEEPPVRLVVGMEGEAEHALLAAAHELRIGNIEEGRRRARRGVDTRDDAGVLGERIDVAVVARRAGDEHGALPDIGQQRRLDHSRIRIEIGDAVPVDRIIAVAAVDVVGAVTAGDRIGPIEAGDDVRAAEPLDRVRGGGSRNGFARIVAGDVRHGHVSRSGPCNWPYCGGNPAEV